MGVRGRPEPEPEQSRAQSTILKLRAEPEPGGRAEQSRAEQSRAEPEQSRDIPTSHGPEREYKHYFGWQRVRRKFKVFKKNWKALSVVANHPVEVQCAGRTDAGVHGTGQVIHFDTDASRKWWLGLWE